MRTIRMERLKVKRAKAVWQVWYVDVVLEDPADGEDVRYDVKVTKRPIPNVPDIPELHCDVTDPRTKEHWLLNPMMETRSFLSIEYIEGIAGYAAKKAHEQRTKIPGKTAENRPQKVVKTGEKLTQKA